MYSRIPGAPGQSHRSLFHDAEIHDDGAHHQEDEEQGTARGREEDGRDLLSKERRRGHRDGGLAARDARSSVHGGVSACTDQSSVHGGGMSAPGHA